MNNTSADLDIQQSRSPHLSSTNLIVLVSGVFHAIYNELLPDFKRESGLRVASYLSPSMGNSPDSVSSRLERGEQADALIMAAEGLEHAISRGLAKKETRVELALAPVGMAVKSGRAKPDISTPAKLKEALLAAKSVAYSISASGKYVSGELFRKLGIDDQMKGKAHEVEGTTPVAERVADGTYELGFQALSELDAVKGVDVVGALPAPVGLLTRVSAAVAKGSRNQDGATTLLRFLTRPSSREAFKNYGLSLPAV